MLENVHGNVLNKPKVVRFTIWPVKRARNKLNINNPTSKLASLKPVKAFFILSTFMALGKLNTPFPEEKIFHYIIET